MKLYLLPTEVKNPMFDEYRVYVLDNINADKSSPNEEVLPGGITARAVTYHKVYLQNAAYPFVYVLDGCLDKFIEIFNLDKSCIS